MKEGIVRGSVFCVLLLMLLAACANGVATKSQATTTKTTPAITPTPTTSTQGVGAAGCHPPSMIKQTATGWPETQGTGQGMEIWALFFNDLKAGHDQKIVWRLTGAGDPHFTPIGPHGEQARVVFGPEAHDSSNWQHNGEEWGTGFNFPVAGCWDLHVTRGKATGDVWLNIK